MESGRFLPGQGGRTDSARPYRFSEKSAPRADVVSCARTLIGHSMLPSYGGSGMAEVRGLVSQEAWRVEAETAQPLLRNRRAWLHAGFCVVSLPHSKPKDARDDHVVD